MLKEQFKTIRNLIHLLGVVLLLSTTVLFPNNTYAHTLSPYKKDYVLYAGDKLDDSFNFTNTSDKQLDFKITVSAYDPQDGTFLDDEIFITPTLTNITIDSGQTKQIEYSLNVPAFHEDGSYFNVVVVEENIPLGESNVGLKAGFGLITGIHIVDENGSIKGAFSDLSQIVLNLVEKGLPYISPTVLKYRYENKSPFVFLPDGEIRVFDTTTNERLLKERLNTEDIKVFPDDFYETSFTFDMWNIQNMFHDLKVVVRTYNQFDNNYIETVALIPGFSQTPFIVGGVAFVVIAVVIVKIRKRSTKRSEDKKSKSK